METVLELPVIESEQPIPTVPEAGSEVDPSAATAAPESHLPDANNPTWMDYARSPSLAATRAAQRVGAGIGALIDRLPGKFESMKPSRMHAIGAIGVVALYATRNVLAAKGLASTPHAPATVGGVHAVTSVVDAKPVAFSHTSPSVEHPIADGVLGSYSDAKPGAYAHQGTVTETVFETFAHEYGQDPNKALSPNAQHDLVEQILDKNGLTDETATHLSAGAKIHMPSEEALDTLVQHIAETDDHHHIVAASGSPEYMLANNQQVTPPSGNAHAPTPSSMLPGLHHEISDLQPSAPATSSTIETPMPIAVSSPNNKKTVSSNWLINDLPYIALFGSPVVAAASLAGLNKMSKRHASKSKPTTRRKRHS